SPAVTRTDGTRRTRRRGNTLGNFHERKHLDILATPMVDPSATKCSTSDIHPPHRAENDGLPLNHGRCGQKTANGAYEGSHDCLWLRSPSTAPEENATSNQFGRKD